MHDIKWIRDHPDDFDHALARRGLAGEAQRLIALDERRRAAIQKAEAALARRNAASKEIGAAKKSNEEATAQTLLAEVARIEDRRSRRWRRRKRSSPRSSTTRSRKFPTCRSDDVPDGKDANDNVEHHHFGAKRNYGFAPKQHFDLGEALGQMDFETAAKLSGARFVVLKSGLARLERALGQFMLDLHTTSTATPKSIRRCWCATMRCSVRRNCRNSETINFPRLVERPATGTAKIDQSFLKQGWPAERGNRAYARTCMTDRLGSSPPPKFR